MITSRDSSVGVATGYGLYGRRSIPDRGDIFLSLLHNAQTGSEAHRCLLSNGYRGLFPRGGGGGKAEGA
jgi:hypothetical protein